MNVSARIYLFPLLLLFALSGCAVNPFHTAQTVEQKGDAAYGQYVIAKEQGAALLNDPNIPEGAKRRLAQAMVASKEVADSLQDALIEYSLIKGELSSGTSSQERLVIAQENISRWLAQAQPVINELVAAVGGLR